MKIGGSSFFNLMMGCGIGSNNRAEMLGLWMMLYFPISCNIKSLSTFGDSKIVMGWVAGSGDFRVATLDSWKRKVHKLMERFDKIEIMHIYI